MSRSCLVPMKVATTRSRILAASMKCIRFPISVRAADRHTTVPCAVYANTHCIGFAESAPIGQVGREKGAIRQSYATGVISASPCDCGAARGWPRWPAAVDHRVQARLCEGAPGPPDPYPRIRKPWLADGHREPTPEP